MWCFWKSVLTSGATGRSSAQLIPRSEHPVIARLKWEGLQFHRNLEAKTGRGAGFRTTGYLALVGSEQRHAVEADVRSLEKNGSKAELIAGSEAKKVHAKLSTRDGELGLYIPEAGYTDPTAATQALVTKAKENGARLYEFTAVQAIKAKRNAVTAILTNRGEIATRAVVLACGIWSNQLLDPLGLALPLFWHRVEVCSFRRPDHVGDHPIIADFISRCYFRPEGEQLTLIGNIPIMRSTVARPDQLDDIDHPDRFKEGVSSATIHELFQKLTFRIPSFSEGYWRRGHACVYDVTPDWHPILALPLKIDGLFVAAGFSGHGFVMSPAIGRIVAGALLAPKKNQEEIALLCLERFERNQPVAFAVG